MADIGEKGLTRKECMDVAAQIEAQQFTLYGPRIAVIRDPADEMIGSIIVPDEAKIKPIRGTIVMVGSSTEDFELGWFQIGDRVTFTKYRNTLFDLPLINGDRVYVEVIHANDIYIGWRH